MQLREIMICRRRDRTFYLAQVSHLAAASNAHN